MYIPRIHANNKFHHPWFCRGRGDLDKVEGQNVKVMIKEY
jgi:hypothetical protein